jgi:putative membrane protein
MKITGNIKNPLLHISIALVTLLNMSSCKQNHASDNTATKNQQDSLKTDSINKERDVSFIVKATGINIEEIRLGQLALEKRTITGVQEAGKMMVEDHTKSLNDLTALAKIKSISIPTSLTDAAQADYKKLDNKSGDDFDKEFADMMVNGHKEAIAMFEKESTESTDLDIRKWALATLPALHKHLDYALLLQSKCKKM